MAQLVFPSYTLQPIYLCLADCFQEICLNNRGLLSLTNWDFSNTSSDISALQAHGSTSLDVDKVDGMLAGNSICVFCNNVTCFGTNKICYDRVIYQSAVSKLSTFCLHGYSVFFLIQHQRSSIFFWRRHSQHAQKMFLSLMASSLVLVVPSCVWRLPT